MSLQVWLPLNGNLNNQGLSDVAVTNSGATVDSNGKIGSCYYCSSASYLYTNNFYLNTETFSVAYWVKYSTIGSWNTYIVSLNNSTSEDYQFMMGSLGDEDGNSSSTSLRINAAYSGRISIPKNEWHHCCATWQNNVVTIYVDGEKDSVFSGVTVNSGATHLNINCRSTSTSGAGYGVTGLSDVYVNDIRIYDHCLSAKEVKEISKGLLCHYKLDNNGFGGENLILESHRVTSGGGASGITSTYMDDGSLKVVSTSGNGNYRSCGFSKDSNSNVGSKLSVGDTYTISLDVKVEEGSSLPNLFINEGNSYKALHPVNGKIINNSWFRAYYTSTWNEPGTSYSNISLHLGFSGAIGTFYFKNFKLEKGSKPTQWCPSPLDDNTLGLDSTTESDCSGYLRNANKVNSPASLPGSPRYEVGCKFTGSEYLTFPNPLTSSSTEFSISCWVKFDNASDTMTICTMRASVGSGIALFKIGSNFRFDDNAQTTFSDYSIPVNTWLHLVVTRSLNSKNLYINGNLVQSTTTVGDMRELYTTGSIGASSASGGNLGNFTKGAFSDFRIYSTALSASDVKELYSTSASIDKNGNMYAYEFKEE